MAALPSPSQVAGTNTAIYEAYYHQVDPNGSGVIQALDAARFLKKSRLSDVVLSKIWDLSDPAGKGYLDKSGLFTALKLVALAQAGKDINMSNIHSETPPPKVGELPKVPPQHPPPPQHVPHAAAAGDWTIKPGERDKYNNLFDSLQPANGLIPGNKVKGVLMESKLPLETLGKIWDLADQDKDGMLDRHEFTVAMHLVYKALEKHAIPTCLPPELRARAPPARPPSRPPSRPASRPPSPQPARPPPPRPAPHAAPPPAHQTNAQLLEELLDFGPAAPAAAAPVPWVVSAAEKAQSDVLFTRADVDRDGFVSGQEIKDTFLRSGLPQPVLAHIWGLCDWDSTGKLSSEQFALAMWLVARRVRGVDPPAALAPEMVPPSCRQQLAPPAASSALAAPPPEEKKPEIVSLGPQPTPELEAIAREIDALARERLALEAEVQAKEREVKVKSAENSSLQSEHDTLAATLKQLENQKGEAQKRLNDLKTQVERLRSQTAAQEAAAAETEAEVAARRAAAATLRERERSLQDDVRRHEAEAEALNSQLRRLVLSISQANIKIQHLEEQERCIEEASAALAAATAAGAAAAHAHLSVAPQYSAQHLERVVRGATPHDRLDEAFEESAEFGDMNGSAGADPFKDAAFDKSSNDPFAPASDHTTGGFKSDPFARGFPGAADPFAGDAFAASDNKSKADDKDEFGSDPFAVLHAPTRADSASPTPSLPPKKHKTPPPRPAPPRPHAPSAAASAAASAASANFANFNNKWAERPPPAQGPVVAPGGSALDFAEDPFKDYRYEDPFDIGDPFADVPDSRTAAAARPTSVAGFETDDFFASTVGGAFPAPERRGGRVSAPIVSAFDPFERASAPLDNGTAANNNNNSSNGNDSWAAWPDDRGAAEDAWARSDARASDGWASSDAWASAAAPPPAAADRNLNVPRPSGTLPAKKEKSPRSVKYARSLVHTIGGIGRRKQEKKEAGGRAAGAAAEAMPSEEQQWAWAAQESRQLQAAAAERRRREDAELQLALAISRSEK